MEKDKNYLSSLKEIVKNELEEILYSEAFKFIDQTEEIAGEIAYLNCTGWDCDFIEVTEFSLTDICTVKFKFKLSGDQDEDKPYVGKKIEGNAIAVIDTNEKISYSEVKAEAVRDEPDEELDL